MQTIAFEQFSMAVQPTATPVSPPEKVMNLQGIIKPAKEMYQPPHGFGTTALLYQSITNRKWGEVSAEGPLDTDLGPFIFTFLVKGGAITPTTPPSGVLTRDWEFIFNVSADDLNRATAYWGDQNLQIWQSPTTFFSEARIVNDASGTEAASLSLTGMSRTPTAVAAPTLPAAQLGQLLPAPKMELWIDGPANPIGTTAVNGRLVRAEHIIQTGITAKYFASGPQSDLSYPATGQQRVSHLSTILTLELPDLTEYNQWASDEILKCRVRHNGALIESVTPDYYYGAEFDTYGPFNALDFGENADGANRTIQLTIDGHYDTTLASDARVMFRNQRTEL